MPKLEKKGIAMIHIVVESIASAGLVIATITTLNLDSEKYATQL